MNCQITSKSTKTIQFVKINGDTLIQMSLEDAKVILNGILKSEITDSLLKVYEDRDSLNGSTIILQLSEINLLKNKVKNQEEMINNYEEMVKLKEGEIEISKYIIEKQKKEIRKQKFIKTLALIGDVALPVITLFVILGLK